MFDIYNCIFIAAFFIACIVDHFYKARVFPEVKYWRLAGICTAVMAFVVTYYAPYMWDHYFSQYRLFDATGLPLWLAVILGLFIYELGIYIWHRSMHTFQPFWQWNHQIHHSAERIDVYGAFYFNPIDIAGFAFAGSLALVLVFGTSPEAAVIIGFITNLLAILQHSNIKTPHWLGYFVMRPEAHAAHHERGVHWRNFGDIPHWDMIFGTYYNPKTFDGQAGFFDGSTAQFKKILKGKDISKAKSAMQAETI